MTDPVRIGTPTAGIDIPSGGTLTRPSVVLGSALLIGVNSSVALTSVTDNGVTLTPVATATNSDTGWSAYFYLVLNAAPGDHVVAVTPSATGEVGIQFIDEWANLFSATVDIVATDGSYGTLYGVGSIGPFAVTPELLVLCIGNVHSPIVATTLPTQGGTWTSGGAGYVGPGGYAMATLLTGATTAITPAFSGDTVNYEGMNFAVAIKPGATAPPATLTTPTETTPTSVGATIGATTDTGNGLLYGVGYVGSVPTDTQIIAGQDATGTLTARGSVNVTATGAAVLQLLSGASNTTYHYALVQVSSGGNSNVLTSSSTFTTLPPAPIISSLSSATANEGSTLTINGSHFHALQDTGGVIIGGIAHQDVASWSDTVIVINVSTGKLPMGLTSLIVKNADGLSSVPQAVTLAPQSGWTTVTLDVPNADTLGRLTCIPDLLSGWQIAYDMKSGNFVLYTDASFKYNKSVISSTSCKAWSPVLGWGPIATETLS